MGRSDQMYRRYRIIDTEDLRDAGAALDQLTSKRKVVKMGERK